MDTITQEQLDLFKHEFPNDEQIQKLTLQEVLAQAPVTPSDWNTPSPGAPTLLSRQMPGPVAPTPHAGTAVPPPCNMAVGWIIFDLICLVSGMVSLRKMANQETITKFAGAVNPVLKQIQPIIRSMAAKNASPTKGVFDILVILYKGNLVPEIAKEFASLMDAARMTKFAIEFGATVAAAALTDGAAFAVKDASLLPTFGEDIKNAVAACS